MNATPSILRKLALPEPGSRLGIDTKAMSVTAVWSTPAEDTDGDVVESAGFSLADHSTNPLILWSHQDQMPPIGKAVNGDGHYCVTKSASELRGTAYFSQKSAFAETIFGLYDEDILRAWSVGFRPTDAIRRKSSRGATGLHVKAALLKECSAVGWGANRDALTVRMQKGFGLKDSRKSHLLHAALAAYILPTPAWSPGWAEHNSDGGDMDEPKAEVTKAETETETEMPMGRFRVVAPVAAVAPATPPDQLTEMTKQLRSATARADAVEASNDALRRENTDLTKQLTDARAQLALTNAAAVALNQAVAKIPETIYRLTGKRVSA